MMRVWTVLLGLWVAACGGAWAHSAAHATYLGNEGVLVVRGDTKVVFDAFYSDGIGTYVVPPAPVASSRDTPLAWMKTPEAALRKAKEPFRV